MTTFLSICCLWFLTWFEVPRVPTEQERQTKEYAKCAKSVAYFIYHHIRINDKQRPELGWFPFLIWPAQKWVLGFLLKHNKVLILKARQLGLSWLCLAYCVWVALFRDGSQIIIFSLREDEAKELVERVSGMLRELPDWLCGPLPKDNTLEIVLPNGSKFKAFSTTKHAGSSFTATVALIDEAWKIPIFKQLINAVEPTVNDGGQLLCITTADKENPNHAFGVMYRKAMTGLSSYEAVFLPWWARPSRLKAWYEQLKIDKEQDDLWQEYPATAAQAMAGRSLSKRFKPAWLEKCVGERKPLENEPANVLGIPCPAVPGLTVYEAPEYGRKYVISADTSEGDVTSDPTPAIVFDAETWEEVAILYGVFDPATQANYLIQVSQYYFGAVICPERNNHGHSVIQEIITHGYQYLLYVNPFDGKHGWLSNVKFKPQAVNRTADVAKSGNVTINSEPIRLELQNLEASTLKAPEGDTDDLAMAYCIGIAALTWPSAGGRDDDWYEDENRV